jgi:hypothetical protein
MSVQMPDRPASDEILREGSVGISTEAALPAVEEHAVRFRRSDADTDTWRFASSHFAISLLMNAMNLSRLKRELSCSKTHITAERSSYHWDCRGDSVGGLQAASDLANAM